MRNWKDCKFCQGAGHAKHLDGLTQVLVDCDERPPKGTHAWFKDRPTDRYESCALCKVTKLKMAPNGPCRGRTRVVLTVVK